MARLTIRQLPDDVYRALRARAAAVGQSVEAHAQAILSRECRVGARDFDPADLSDFIDALYRDQPRPANEVDDFLHERREEARRG